MHELTFMQGILIGHLGIAAAILIAIFSRRIYSKLRKTEH